MQEAAVADRMKGQLMRTEKQRKKRRRKEVRMFSRE